LTGSRLKIPDSVLARRHIRAERGCFGLELGSLGRKAGTGMRWLAGVLGLALTLGATQPGRAATPCCRAPRSHSSSHYRARSTSRRSYRAPRVRAPRAHRARSKVYRYRAPAVRRSRSLAPKTRRPRGVTVHQRTRRSTGRVSHRASHPVVHHARAPRIQRAPGSRDRRGRLARSEGSKKRFERLTGHSRGWPGHVVDHIIPLACGGPDVPTNMQWQTVAEGKAKDKVERRGCAR